MRTSMQKLSARVFGLLGRLLYCANEEASA